MYVSLCRGIPESSFRYDRRRPPRDETYFFNFFFFCARHALLLISHRRGDAELGTRYVGVYRCLRLSLHGRQICVRQNRFYVVSTVFSKSERISPSRHRLEAKTRRTYYIILPGQPTFGVRYVFKIFKWYLYKVFRDALKIVCYL